MRCWRAKRLFSAYLDDELRGHELSVFRGHLEGCPGCRRELTELRSLKESIGSVGYRLPAGFKRTLLSNSRLANLVTERFRERGGARTGRPNMRLVLIAGSVVILAVGVGLFGLDDMAKPPTLGGIEAPFSTVRRADEAPAPAEIELEREGIAEAVVEAVEKETGPEGYLSEHLAAAEVAQSSTEELSRHVIADEALNRAADADIPAEPVSSARFSLVSTGAPIPDVADDLPPLPLDAAAEMDTEAAIGEVSGE